MVYRVCSIATGVFYCTDKTELSGVKQGGRHVVEAFKQRTSQGSSSCSGLLNRNYAPLWSQRGVSNACWWATGKGTRVISQIMENERLILAPYQRWITQYDSI